MTKTGLAAAFFIVLGAAAGLCRAQETFEAAQVRGLAIVQAVMAKSPDLAGSRDATDVTGRMPVANSRGHSQAPAPPGKVRESAARALESLITARGPEAAAAEYRKTVEGNARYVVVEREFAALGDRYWKSGRVREAIAVFELATEALPNAWSAWNSLGQAYLLLSWNPESARVAGDLRDKAEVCYAKSVALNPRNDKGRYDLNELRAAKFDAANETKTPLRFVPGAQMKLTGPYLGQPAPGLAPQVFAPGIVSVAGHFDFGITFTPDGNEVYFSQRKGEGRNTIMVSRLETDGWTAPEEAAFAKGDAAHEPHITPDGRSLYFGGDRRRPGSAQAGYGLWVVERTAGGGWSEAKWFGPGMYVSVARNGNLYMTDIARLTGTGPAPAAASRAPGVVRRWTGTEYTPPQRLPGAINSPAEADHSFIAPDETYILFDSKRPGGQGGSDLYVCFRKPDSSWSEAMNLGDAVNTPGGNIAPSVSPDGKYIFYTANRDIYWVSAGILEPLRAKALLPPCRELVPWIMQSRFESLLPSQFFFPHFPLIIRDSRFYLALQMENLRAS